MSGCFKFDHFPSHHQTRCFSLVFGLMSFKLGMAGSKWHPGWPEFNINRLHLLDEKWVHFRKHRGINGKISHAFEAVGIFLFTLLDYTNLPYEVWPAGKMPLLTFCAEPLQCRLMTKHLFQDIFKKFVEFPWIFSNFSGYFLGKSIALRLLCVFFFGDRWQHSTAWRDPLALNALPVSYVRSCAGTTWAINWYNDSL